MADHSQKPVTIKSRSATRAGTVKASGKFTSVKNIVFGQVEITGSGVKPSTIKRNVSTGQLAFERLAKTLNRPGVNIKPVRGVPLFYVDSDDPDVMIRVLDGKRVKGKLENGRFKAL